MRFLTWTSRNELCLTEAFDRDKRPPYAILSHTWGLRDDEVTFTDLQQGRGKSKKGYKKLLFCYKQTQKDRIKHFWVDTCCINKTDSVELSEAINSMYYWYRDAKKCYVYLSDVPIEQSSGSDDSVEKTSTWQTDFSASRWFTRGWTLQKLLAPKVVEFFSCNGTFLGTKRTLAEQVCEATGLPLAALYGTPPAQFSVAERWRWAQGRQTSRREDGAYCMLGIFDVFLPLIYGEGDNAFLRLENEVNERSGKRIGNSTVFTNHAAKMPGSYQRSASTQPVVPDDEDVQEALERRDVGQAGVSDRRDRRPAVEWDRGSGKRNYEKLVSTLRFDRMDFRVNNVKKPLLSTCEWLLHHPHFQAWYSNDTVNQHSGFLWIKGKPGCGKSTLMKAALEWAEKRNTDGRVQQIIVPYFFNARGSDDLEKCALGLYRTIVYRLLSTYESFRPLFMERFYSLTRGTKGKTWTEEELQNFLCDIVDSNESFRLCLFIDALDEADYDDDVRKMISFLIELSDRALATGDSCRLQICLSSRHYPHISIGRGLSLVVEDQPEHGRDIEIYISKHLTCSDGPEKNALQVNILRKSAWIFLWVVLVVQMLNALDDRGAPLSDMQARLDTIPMGLSELFREILLKSSHNIETTILFFQWLVFSMRSLQPAELFVAVEYSRSSADPAWVPPTTVLPPSADRLARYVLDCSHGLAESVRSWGGGPLAVQFIHETVREFLVTENGLISVVPDLASNLTGISHQVLRIACFRCISASTITPEEIPGDSYPNWGRGRSDWWDTSRYGPPFLTYAVLHLLDHAERAQSNHISQLAFLETQVTTDGMWSDWQRRWWNALESYHRTGIVESDMSLLYFLIKRRYWSLVPTVPNLVEAVNRSPRYQPTALELASIQGDLRIVQSLLDAGAKVNALEEIYGSALQAASLCGHDKVVRVLIKAGAEVNAQAGVHGTALQVASLNGHAKVVQSLVEGMAEIDAQGQEYGTALQAASLHGHETVVRMLIGAGADVNAQGGWYGTALLAASLNGHIEVVKMLIKGGADVNAQGGAYGSAIAAASRRNHREVEHILRRAGAGRQAPGVKANVLR